VTKAKRQFGSWGEDTAAKYLVDKGYEIKDRNVRTKYGEIDILAQQGGVLVFVEVKTRNSTAFGFPEESVTQLKQQHLQDAAQEYLQLHPEQTGEWRIDVISVLRISSNEPEIAHIENAIGG
jgi:putative endonuclease